MEPDISIPGNISPGEIVPADGEYSCEMCFMKKTSPFKMGDGKITIKSFNKGEIFPFCPVCGKATGWSILTERTKRWAIERFDFNIDQCRR